jgi:hypothetical protein
MKPQLIEFINITVMKKILSAFLVLFAFCAKAQTDSSEIEMNSVNIVFVKLPVSTAIGAPDGKSVSKEIGPAGGKIISDDGRVELIFPGGALSVNTAISIQPIVNLIPNGNGKAYQFEPSGIKFQKPVQVIFHYTDEEAEICPPELKFMAIQDHNGKWEYMNYADWDNTGKSLKGFISHFSAMLDGNLMDLSPNEKTLKVGESFPLSLTVVVAPGEDELSPLPSTVKRQIKWFVKGGASFGTISPGSNKYNVIYTAPGYLRGNNPEVVLQINKTIINEVMQHTRHAKGGIWRGSTSVPETKNLATFICNINLYDDYRITIIHQGPSILKCGAELEDRSIFQARLYSRKVEITDVINSEPTLTKLPNCKNESRGGRGADYTLTYDHGGCQGPVHVSNDRLNGYGMMINDRTITPPDITIEFVPNIVKIMNGKIHYPPTPGGSTNKFFLKRQKIIPPGEAKDETVSEEDINVGNKIQFTANRMRQEYNRPGDKTEHSFQLLIEPL